MRADGIELALVKNTVVASDALTCSPHAWCAVRATFGVVLAATHHSSNCFASMILTSTWPVSLANRTM
jgi:hypothetical protein